MDPGPVDWLRLKTNIILGLAWQYVSPLMQHSLAVKTRCAESFSDTQCSSLRQTTTTTSQLGLRSSSTCNKGRNHRLRNDNLMLLSVNILSPLVPDCHSGNKQKTELGGVWVTQPCWFQPICQKTEFLFNCSFLWQLSSVLHHHLHAHSCSLEVEHQRWGTHTFGSGQKVRCRRAHFSQQWNSTIGNCVCAWLQYLSLPPLAL